LGTFSFLQILFLSITAGERGEIFGRTGLAKNSLL